MSAKPIYLDCDTGIDDALALAYLLARADADLVGIGTVSGNTDAHQAAINTSGLLAMAGRSDIAVAEGERDWLKAAYDGGSPHVHGKFGVGDLVLGAAPQPLGAAQAEPGAEQAATSAESAAQMLIRLSHEYAGELTVLAIGPLTNLARALEIDPGLAGRVASVVVMGGAAAAPGNISPVAEANIMHDPEAAEIVIHADWDVVLVPLDVTMRHTMSEDDRRRLEEAPSELVRAVARMLGFYFDFYVDIYGRRSCALHDPLAAAIALGAAYVANVPALKVRVDTTAGPARGQTICDLRGMYRGLADVPGANARVVLDATWPIEEGLMAPLLQFDPARV